MTLRTTGALLLGLGVLALLTGAVWLFAAISASTAYTSQPTGGPMLLLGLGGLLAPAGFFALLFGIVVERLEQTRDLLKRSIAARD